MRGASLRVDAAGQLHGAVCTPTLSAMSIAPVTVNLQKGCCCPGTWRSWGEQVVSALSYATHGVFEGTQWMYVLQGNGLVVETEPSSGGTNSKPLLIRFAPTALL